VEYNAASDRAKMQQEIINELLKAESAQKQAKTDIGQILHGSSDGKQQASTSHQNKETTKQRQPTGNAATRAAGRKTGSKREAS